ncbi:hypothetical protein P4O66_009926 [Electrophorus voltai]|uniref:Uncharacterized protein n=1 Tax=Electrophorus voltai TaxID=2609070 RepID=A0AAD8ZAK5_9TELE|nr:hypothetical protein P4O66_009926 [Electrophorus voltai]
MECAQNHRRRLMTICPSVILEWAPLVRAETSRALDQNRSSETVTDYNTKQDLCRLMSRTPVRRFQRTVC